jgi:hypothetical protein
MYSRKEKEKNAFLTRERPGLKTWSLEAWHKLPGY